MSRIDDVLADDELVIYCKPVNLPPQRNDLNPDALRFDANGWSVNNVDHFSGSRLVRRTMSLQELRKCSTIRSSQSLVFFIAATVKSCGHKVGCALSVTRAPEACERGTNDAHCLVTELPSESKDREILKQLIAMAYSECMSVKDLEATS